MPDLLFELGVEEIPARFLAAATTELAQRGRKSLEDAGFFFSDLTAWSTPRRLTLFAKELCFD
ncbi:MAG: glycine--tRNA ligase subunit beta, partial [bacterium]